MLEDYTHLTPGHSLGQVPNSTRLSSLLTLLITLSSILQEMDGIHHTSYYLAIFSESTYDADFGAIIGDITSPVLTRGTFEEVQVWMRVASCRCYAKEEMQQFVNQDVCEALCFARRRGKLLFGTNMASLMNKRDARRSFAIKLARIEAIRSILSILPSIYGFYAYIICIVKSVLSYGKIWMEDSLLCDCQQHPMKPAKPKAKDELLMPVNAFIYTRSNDRFTYCKKQTVVATSSTEAEYVAAAHCCGQLHDEGGIVDMPIPDIYLGMDNLGYPTE
ncbi:hypothetical protein Tco_0246765, partial [Tanacetum coccineum]